MSITNILSKYLQSSNIDYSSVQHMTKATIQELSNMRCEDKFDMIWSKANVMRIDHILVNSRFSNCVLDIRSFRGADCGSDHFLVAGKLKVTLKKIENRKESQSGLYDISKLSDPKVCETFHTNILSEIKRNQQNLNTNNDDVEIIWSGIKRVIQKATAKTVGKQRRIKKPWFNQICEDALQRRKQAREDWLNDTQNEEKYTRYKMRQKEASNILRCEKRKHIQGIVRDAEQDYKSHKSRDLYRKIHTLSKEFKPNGKFLRNEDGTLITNKEDIVRRWADYFDQLLNCEEPHNPFHFEHRDPNIVEYPEPTIEEIMKQIKILKNNKAPGEDKITRELLKTMGGDLIEYIHRLVGLIWRKEVIPKEWRTALVCPIHKKGDRQLCNNYRGIALLNVAYKILSYCLLDRIKPWAEEILGDYQAGFRQNRSTIDQIFILRQLLQKMWEYDRDVHMLFVDFKKAYDSIHRESLINILKEFEMPQKLINLIKMNIDHTDIKVKVGHSTSNVVQVTTGLRQGDALSPILFNIALEKVVREIRMDQGGVRIGDANIGLLAYADDIVLLAENKDQLRRQANKLIENAKRIGLEINTEKTEYMVVQRKVPLNNQNSGLEVEGHTFKRIQQFKYLGAMLTQQNEINNEVKARIQAGNRCYFGLTKLLRSRTLSTNLKIQIYRTLIKPVVTYGSETWTLRKTDENSLTVFERKVLRKIYGPCKDVNNGEWRIRKNRELKAVYQNPGIVEDITKRRLIWAGHAWRKEGSLLRTVIEKVPQGKRPLGRPRLRWEDRVKEDVEKVKPGEEWKVLSLERESWRQICWTVWS